MEGVEDEPGEESWTSLMSFKEGRDTAQGWKGKQGNELIEYIYRVLAKCRRLTQGGSRLGDSTQI